MKTEKKPIKIIVAEDDDNDFLLIQRVFKKNHISNQIIRVQNGLELLNYLEGDQFSHEEHVLLFLDLNMPVMDGREFLEKIKSNQKYDKLFIIVLTQSQMEEDKLKSYNYGIDTFISKPVTYQDLTNILRNINDYYIELVA